MVPSDKLIGFIVASILIMVVPGPSVMFVIARAVAWGRGTAFMTVVGNALGMLVLSVAIALGLGPLLQSSEILLNTVQIAGGLYLVYLGAVALRHRVEHVDGIVNVQEEKPTLGGIIRQGFLVGVLNPKALVFFAAVFPQFVSPETGSVTTQLLIFGAIFSVLAVIFDGSWAIAVGAARDWFVTSSSRLVALRAIGGYVMITLGVLVVIPVIRHILSQ